MEIRTLLVCPICGRVKFADNDDWELIDFKTKLYLFKKVKEEIYEKKVEICSICRSEENP